VVETSSYSKANKSKQRRHICHAADTPVTLHNKHNTGPTDVRVWHSKAALKHKQHRRVTEIPSVESSGRIHVATVSDTDKHSRHRWTRSRNPLLRTWRYCTYNAVSTFGFWKVGPIGHLHPAVWAPRERRGIALLYSLTLSLDRGGGGVGTDIESN
jgi:hypothetical protein